MKTLESIFDIEDDSTLNLLKLKKLLGSRVDLIVSKKDMIITSELPINFDDNLIEHLIWTLKFLDINKVIFVVRNNDTINFNFEKDINFQGITISLKNCDLRIKSNTKISNVKISCLKKDYTIYVNDDVKFENSTIVTKDLSIRDTKNQMLKLRNSNIKSKRVVLYLDEDTYDYTQLSNPEYLKKIIHWNPNGWDMDILVIMYIYYDMMYGKRTSVGSSVIFKCSGSNLTLTR